MKILAIDGNSILNRAYYGIRKLTNKNGVYTNAVFGFLNIYFKNIEEVNPDGVAVMRLMPFSEQFQKNVRIPETNALYLQATGTACSLLIPALRSDWLPQRKRRYIILRPLRKNMGLSR